MSSVKDASPSGRKMASPCCNTHHPSQQSHHQRIQHQTHPPYQAGDYEEGDLETRVNIGLFSCSRQQLAISTVVNHGQYAISPTHDYITNTPHFSPLQSTHHRLSILSVDSWRGCPTEIMEDIANVGEQMDEGLFGVGRG